MHVSCLYFIGKIPSFYMYPVVFWLSFCSVAQIVDWFCFRAPLFKVAFVPYRERDWEIFCCLPVYTNRILKLCHLRVVAHWSSATPGQACHCLKNLCLWQLPQPLTGKGNRRKVWCTIVVVSTRISNCKQIKEPRTTDAPLITLKLPF